MSATAPFDWASMSRYLGPGRMWPSSYPDNQWDFFSPEDGDGMAQALVDIIGGAGHSLESNHYGFDFGPVNEIMKAKAAIDGFLFVMNLDSSQAAGAHEKELLSTWSHDSIGTSIAIGRSSRGAISHLKVTIVDKEIVLCGSTNLSEGGIQKQDNQLTIFRNTAVAAWYSIKLAIDHDVMLKQMSAKAAV